MSRENVCAAANVAVKAVSEAETVSLHWSWPGMAISFNWDHGRWFWAAYDRKIGRTAGCGCAATIEAAVEQARDATQAKALAAE